MLSPNFHFITLFPETIDVWFSTSIPGRAKEKGLFSINTIQLRDFGMGPHRTVDDAPYGGGGGMVMRPEPLVAATKHVLSKVKKETALVVAFTPCGIPLDAKLLEQTQQKKIENYILVCGHYEGIDQRFLDRWVDLEISLGDFVITGGELAAMAFVDASIRHLDGTLSSEGSAKNESFSLRHPTKNHRLLEHPQFTRPPSFDGQDVPEVLLSGDHKAIDTWRMEKSIERTTELRPDLIR